MALFLVYQKPDSIYDDEHGIGYHYPARIPNGRQVSEGDYLVCSLTSKTSAAGRRIFGIGDARSYFAAVFKSRSGGHLSQ